MCKEDGVWGVLLHHRFRTTRHNRDHSVQQSEIGQRRLHERASVQKRYSTEANGKK